MSRLRTFFNHTTGASFEVTDATTSADCPAWVLEQIQMAQRILARARPMCPGYAKLELRLMAATEKRDQLDIISEMRAHIQATDCSRVEKAEHSEKWIFEEDNHE